MHLLRINSNINQGVHALDYYLATERNAKWLWVSHFFLWVLGYSEIIGKPDSHMILIQHHEKLTQGEIGTFVLYVLFVQDVKTHFL